MIAAEVTLSCGARAECARLGIAEPVARRARARPSSSHERPMYLVVTAELPDGRRLQMSCRHDRPHHVASLRLA